MWYYASFIVPNDKDFCPDDQFFECENDEKAIAFAKELANFGADYGDVGHVDLELLSVTEVDPDMWKVGCFYGTGEQLINKAFEDSIEKGFEYKKIVDYVESILENQRLNYE